MTWRVLHGRWGATCAEKALCTWIANPVVVAMMPWMRAHGLGRDFLCVILAWPQGSSWTQTRLSDSALFVERDTFRVGHHVSCIGTSRHVSPRRDVAVAFPFVRDATSASSAFTCVSYGISALYKLENCPIRSRNLHGGSAPFGTNVARNARKGGPALRIAKSRRCMHKGSGPPFFRIRPSRI